MTSGSSISKWRSVKKEAVGFTYALSGPLCSRIFTKKTDQPMATYTDTLQPLKQFFENWLSSLHGLSSGSSFARELKKSEFSAISLPVFKCRQFCEQGVDHCIKRRAKRLLSFSRFPFLGNLWSDVGGSLGPRRGENKDGGVRIVFLYLKVNNQGNLVILC